jgi:RNA polymerase sigma factor (sigma-70 family)
MDQRQTTTPEQFSAAYEQHLPAIVRYLGRRLGDSAAEDAAAEVFIRAFRQRDRDATPSVTGLPWLYGIAGNVISEHRRAERRRLKLIERIAASPASEFASHPKPDQQELSPELAKALRRLSDGDRDTLLLVAWGELTYEETAQVLDIPVGTVRSRLVRVRRTLDRDLRPATTNLHLTSSTGAQHV